MKRNQYIVDYVKRNIKRYELRLNKVKDKEIIEHISKQVSVSRYLRNLVELEMKKDTR